MRDAKRLTRLLCDRIETIDPGFGIEVMTLAATVAEPLVRRSRRVSALVEEPTPDVSDLVDLLANRVGEARGLPRGAGGERRAGALGLRISPRWRRTPARAGPATGRGPSRLLRRPEPIETVALLPDHPPVSFTWRGVRRRVRRADGPERVFGEWWKRDAELIAVRDYFRVEDEAGERYWIYRAGDGEDAATGSHRWFLHGIFG